MSDRREFIKKLGVPGAVGVTGAASLAATVPEEEPREITKVVVLDEDLKKALEEAYDFLDDLDLEYLGDISWRLDEKRRELREKLRRFIIHT
jgi:hypothetical protein